MHRNILSIWLSLVFLVLVSVQPLQAAEKAAPAQEGAQPAGTPQSNTPQDADSAQAKEPATLLVMNNSPYELVALRITSDETTGFARLNLGPGDEDELENPGGTAAVYLDLGLSLGSWKNIPLDSAKRLTLCGKHPTCLVVQDAQNKETHYTGELKSLLPTKDDKPACALDGFHAGMTMKQVCGLLKEQNEIEDNILLTSMGFANIVWSARIFADKDKNGKVEDAVLDGVELRQKLTKETLNAVVKDMAKRSYVPWQASLPGMEITFSEMTSCTEAEKESLLAKIMAVYLAHSQGSAVIRYVPADVMAKLANAEIPDQETQIYTVTTHGQSQTIVLEMTAYTFEELKQ